MGFGRSISRLSLLVLLLGGGCLEGAIAAPTNQEQVSEIDRALAKGSQLFQEGSKKSLTAAISQFEIALRLSRSHEIRSREAIALLGIGRIYYLRGQKQEALQYFSQALPLFREVKEAQGEATILWSIGAVYDAIGQKSEAIQSYNQALSLIRSIDSSSSNDTTLSSIKAVILNNLGAVFFDMGNQQKAIEYYNQALSISRTIKNPRGEAVAFNNLGSVYGAIGNKKKALELYNQALSLLSTTNYPRDRATTLNNIALVYNALGSKEKAIEYYDKALSLFQIADDLGGKAYTLNNIGELFLDLGEQQKALEYYNQALPLFQVADDPIGQAIALSNISKIHNNLGDRQQSFNFNQQALTLYHTAGDRRGEAAAFTNMCYVLKQINQPEQAIAFCKQSVNIYETLRADIKSLSRNDQSIYTQTIAVTYRNLADLLTQQGRLTEAQQVIELLKIGELKQLSPTQQQSQTPIQQIPISDAEKQSIAQINPEIAKDIKPEALPSRDRLSSHPLNQSAQALLNAQPNSALIYHLLTNDKLWILLITPDGKIQKFASGGNKTTIESIVIQFRKQIEQCEKQVCDRADTNIINTISQQLYQQLFPKDFQAALAQAKPTHLTLALDGSLRNIPIAALHTGQQYLIEQYSLSQIIAAQLTNSQDKLPPTANQTSILAVGTAQSAGIAIPDYVDASGFDLFPALGNVPLELAAIISNEPNTNTFSGEQLLDQAFTLPNLQQKLPRHRILHIASHGIFRPNFLDYSYILLGNGTDRKWSIPQMDNTNRNLFQNIHLVTLSACQTGLGDRDNTGMEIAGMSHAFLSQGAKAVQATLWQVNDASTAMLMQRFYQNLAQNPQATKAQALQQAQLYLLRTPQAQLNKNFMDSLSRFENLDKMNQSSKSPSRPKILDKNHPYYWAAFILIGNNR
jgi:CHAT domain-containing protein/Tfp pilus assembly protein PilF